ncbi:hypothetical protein LUZ60_002348 [Juncus effusus]|nr:hypothetical protein LUZ60_002348 [Juncus effusus]
MSETDNMDINQSLLVSSSEPENPESEIQESEIPDSPKPERRKPNRKSYSTVWNYFTKRIGSDGKEKACCNLCNREYMVSPVFGTTNLHRHIEHHHVPKGKNMSQMLVARAVPVQNSVPKQFKYDELAFKESLVKMVVENEFEFEFLEKDGVKRCFGTICPDLKFVSGDILRGDLVKLYEKERKKVLLLFEKLARRVSVSIDLWTNVKTEEYICVNAHYIDRDWKLRKTILNFKYLPSPYDGNSLAKFISNLLKSWKIENKLFCITLDEALSDDSFLDIYKTQLISKKALLLQGKFFSSKCCARVINLIVHEALKEIDIAIYKIRECVKYVKGSNERLKKFLDCCKKCNIDPKTPLFQDIPTKWKTTFLMIEHILPYKNAFNELQTLTLNFTDCPTIEEWNSIDKMHQFIKTIYDATDAFSSAKYPTSHLCFHGICKIQIVLKEKSRSMDYLINKVATRMLSIFDEYWREFSTILSVSVVLDPRYKMEFVEYAFKKIHEGEDERFVGQVKQSFQALFNEYKGNFASGSKKGEKNKEKEKNTEEISQLELYLSEPNVDWTRPLDVLEWWRENQPRYPDLARLARDVLAVPLCPVVPQSAFQIGGRVLDKYKGNLKPDVLEPMVCTKDWMFGFEGINAKVEEDDGLKVELGSSSKDLMLTSS